MSSDLNNSIIRAAHNKENPYAQISKAMLHDKRLSAKAKGILCYLLSLPSNWKIHIKELVNHFSDGEDSIRSGLKELQKFGYLTIERIRDDKGRVIGTEILIYEDCLLPGVSIFPSPETHGSQGLHPYRDFPDMGFPDMGNPPLLNTDLTKTDLKQTAAYARAPSSLNTKEKEQAKAVVAAFVEGAEKKGHGEFNYTPSTEPLVVDLGRIDISNDRAERLILKYGEARVREAMEYAQAKAKTNPGGYFEKTLAAEWGKGWKEKKEAPKEEDESIARRNQEAVEERKRKEAYEAGAKIKQELVENPGKLQSNIKNLRAALRPNYLSNKTIGAN